MNIGCRTMLSTTMKRQLIMASASLIKCKGGDMAYEKEGIYPAEDCRHCGGSSLLT
jgi:hypothetical protein